MTRSRFVIKAILNSCRSGGRNACLVLKRYEERVEITTWK
jgi:hypothetical protein